MKIYRRNVKEESIVKELIIVFFICYIPRLIMSLKAYPLLYISDETSALSIAAFIAGNDWREVVSHAGYYGFGFLWIFAPLFKWIDSPLWIYRVILIILAAVLATVGPFCYCILDKYFLDISKNKRVIISSVCGCLTLLNTAAMSARNEEIFNLIVWVIVYLLSAILYETDSKKIKYEIVLVLILGFSLTVHARSVALYMGIIVASILYYLFYKKELVHKAFYIIMALEYVVINKFVEIYQGSIWKANVRNSSVSDVVTSSLLNFNIDEETIQGIFMIFGGQIYTAIVFTGGIFLVAIVAVCIYFFKIKDFINKRESCYIAVIGGMFLFCALLTIGGQSLTWLSGVRQGLIEGTYKDAYRGFTYMRYMGVYVPPVVMYGLIVMDLHYDILKSSIKTSFFILVLLTLFWINVVLPKIENRLDIYFMTLSQTKAGIKVLRDDWLKASIAILGIMFIWFLFVYKKQLMYQLVLIIMLLILERIYIFENSTYIEEQKIYAKADAGYKLLKEIELSLEIKDVYVFDASGHKDHQIFYMYQFMNNSLHIIPELPDELNSETIIFSNQDINVLLSKNHYSGKLDDNEYVYCFGERYKEIIEEQGINLVFQ